ncbi:MAG TPA: inorganic phosphate transporter [Thermoanaerobaculia bacterium]|nr:inorganic phosphate transporter [Thermoanaerobaculia bacterium]
MTMTLVAMLGLVPLLAYGNGANDISKGIATLVGSGVSSFQTAVVWGTIWTVFGGLLAAAASQGLVATFSGKGFLARPIEGTAFLSAVAIGAIAWVLFASRTGLPISTTHAIAGALAGAGLVAQGAAALHWSFLAKKVALPLALSPLLSVALIYAVFPLLRGAVSRVETYCLCLERRALIVENGAFTVSVGSSTVVAPVEECAASPAVAARISAVDALHWFSSALTSLARGLNDTPKIAALGVVAAAGLGISGFRFYLVVAVAMAGGSWIAGLRVTETLARRVTPMSPGEGFAANLVTTLLVGAASLAALPVSTTHVSSGSIIGIGLRRGVESVRWSTVRDMLLAWLVTLPVAALVAAGVYALFRVVG